MRDERAPFHLTARMPTRARVGGLSIVLALPALASAAPLCITLNSFGDTVVIPLPQFAKGQTRAVVGSVHTATNTAPVAGTTITSSDGTQIGIALTAPNVFIGAGGSVEATSGTGRIINMVFGAADRRLNVGDGGLAISDTTITSTTVVDCATVPHIP